MTIVTVYVIVGMLPIDIQNKIALETWKTMTGAHIVLLFIFTIIILVLQSFQIQKLKRNLIAKKKVFFAISFL